MKEYILECRLTAKTPGNEVTAVEFKKRGENLADLKHIVVDIDAKHIVEDNSMWGKLALRMFVSEKELFQQPKRIETLHFSTERPRVARGFEFKTGRLT